jgi:hypothetical protein
LQESVRSELDSFLEKFQEITQQSKQNETKKEFKEFDVKITRCTVEKET